MAQKPLPDTLLWAEALSLIHIFDWTVPDDLAELPAIVGGKEMDFKYKDCKKEMDMVNNAFIETMIEGCLLYTSLQSRQEAI